MKKLFIIVLILFTGCAGNPKEEQETRCAYIKGEGRYGTFLQYIKGDAEIIRVVKGIDFPAKVICRTVDGNLSVIINDDTD